MAATADPRAKPPTTAAHHLKPWVPSPTPRAHRVPSLPAVSGGGGGASRPTARDRRRSSSTHRRGGTGTGTDAGGVDEEEAFDGGLEDLRAKLMGHIKDVADRLHLPQPKPPRSRSPEPDPPAAPLPPPPPPPPQESSAAAAAAARPWNLRERKRRSAARGSTSSASPTRAWAARQAETARDGGERAPFAVALAAEEIEEDIYSLTGGRPRRRPRKRPRVVQRQLDSLFPGLWLTEITADAYKVPDD